MTFVVTDNCINCKHTTCVEVCPVDAFREGPNFLVIDPELCVDCDMCPSECPVDAIYADDDLAEEQRHFIELNAELAQQWPQISEPQDPLPDYQQWEDKTDKLQYLDRS